MGLVSIILTTLNSEKYLAYSLESCLAQTHAEIEIIIVDGGSQDQTLDIVAGFQDKRLRLIHQAGNNGKLPGAINLGMANARGDFITWTQDDVWYEPKAIEVMLEYLYTHPETALVYADYWDVDEEGSKLSYQRVHPLEDMLVDDVVRICFLFDRKIYDTMGPQKIQYFPVHDVPWRVNAAQKFVFSPLHTPLLYYRVHQGSLTGKYGGWQLQQMMATALWQEGFFTNKEYQHRQAAIEIDHAFAEFVISGSFAHFWRYALSGIRLNLRHIKNRGLWKYAIISLLPNRRTLRDREYARWQTQDLTTQQEQIRLGISLSSAGTERI